MGGKEREIERESSVVCLNFFFLDRCPLTNHPTAMATPTLPLSSAPNEILWKVILYHPLNVH